MPTNKLKIVKEKHLLVFAWEKDKSLLKDVFLDKLVSYDIDHTLCQMM